MGVPTALVTIGSWVAALFGLDLDPGAGTDMPTVVTGAWIAVLTFAMAYGMNRGKLRGEARKARARLEAHVHLAFTILFFVQIPVARS